MKTLYLTLITFTISLLPSLWEGPGMGFLFSQSPGSLDLSFDTDGKVTTDFGSVDYGTSVAIQADGKIVVAGYSFVFAGSDYDFSLCRYNSDGSLDNSFDSDGKLTTPIGVYDDNGHSVTIQVDGKILVAGSTDDGTVQGFALVRYNINGSLDTTFDTDGKVTTQIGSSSDAGYSVTIQTDGKILVAGFSNNGSTDDFALVRYNSNGSLDTTFDSDGKLTTPIGSSSDFGLSVILQSDGKIVVAGASYNGSDFDFALVRYNSDGSLDTTFNLDGKLITSFGSTDDRGWSVAIQSDGKILVAGFSSSNFALARYNSDGSLDNTLSGDGKLTTDFGGSIDAGYSVALQSDGKILVAGSSADDFALARYNSDGSLDTAFSSDGKLTTNFGSSQVGGNSVAIQLDGKILVTGSTGMYPVFDFALARYLSVLSLGLIDFSLDNNSVLIYPNPIAQDSKLEYILNTPEDISISLFDMQGKMVKTFLNNEHQEAGSYTQTLNLPEGMASGSYYVVISTPGGKVSVKIIK